MISGDLNSPISNESVYVLSAMSDLLTVLHGIYLNNLICNEKLPLQDGTAGRWSMVKPILGIQYKLHRTSGLSSMQIV